jgi:hypothetical protein
VGGRETMNFILHTRYVNTCVGTSCGGRETMNFILHTRYVSTCVGAGCGGRETTNKIKAIRCGACYYSIVLNAHPVTSMAGTDTDAVRKQKKAEYVNNTD